MSPKTFIAIFIILVLLIGGVFWLTISKQNTKSLNQTATNQKKTKKQTSQTILTFDNVSKSLDAYTLPVIIKSEDNTITGIQLEISYDPQTLGSVDIQPGQFFSKPTVLLKKIDHANGTISYALGINPQDNGVKGQGTVALLSFRTKSRTSQTTTVSFVETSLVASEETDDSVLTLTIPTQFVVGQI